jgi:hypothetical protein
MEIFLPLTLTEASARGAGASFFACGAAAGAAGVAGVAFEAGAAEFCARDEQAQQINNSIDKSVRVFIYILRNRFV